MQLTKGAIGNLINRYRAVLKNATCLTSSARWPWLACWSWGVLRPRGRWPFTKQQPARMITEEKT